MRTYAIAPPGKLFVTGATGRTGQRVIDRALARGHSVTALARRPNALAARPGLRVVRGDATRASELARAIVGHEAVISCLGPRSRDDPHLLRDATTALLAAMTHVGVKRCVVISQGLLFKQPGFTLAILRRILRWRLSDSADMEELMQASNTDWTIVRPPRLVDGPERGYRVEVGRAPCGASSISYADVAAYLVDAVETGSHVRAVVGLASS